MTIDPTESTPTSELMTPQKGGQNRHGNLNDGRGLVGFGRFQLRARKIVRWIDAIWGHDAFISHRNSDGAPYAKELYRGLKNKKLAPFIDSEVYVPGDPLPTLTQRHVENSTILVLLITPDIASPRDPDWVLTEIEAYLESHSASPRVIAIFLTDDAHVLAHPIVRKVTDGQYIHIPQSRSGAGASPSDEVLEAIDRQLGNRRRDRDRLRLFQKIAAGLFGLSFLLAVAAIGFWVEWGTADTNAREATSRLLALDSKFERHDLPQRGLLLAIASVDATREPDKKTLPEAFAALVEASEGVWGLPIGADVGRLRIMPNDDNNLMIGITRNGQLMTFDPFQENPSFNKVSLSSGGPVVSADINRDGAEIVVLDKTSTISRCTISNAVASSCETILKVEGALGILAAKGTADRILLTKAHGQEVWDLNKKTRVYTVSAPQGETYGPSFIISPDGRFLARQTEIRRGSERSTSLIQLADVDTGETTQFDWRGDARYVQINFLWFAPDSRTLIVELTRWRADSTGARSLMGVRLSGGQLHDFDIAKVLGWDTTNLIDRNSSGLIVRKTTAGALEIYRSGGDNGVVRIGGFVPTFKEPNTSVSIAANGCMATETGPEGGTQVHLGICDRQTHEIVALPGKTAVNTTRFVFNPELGLLATFPDITNTSVRVWRIDPGPGRSLRQWSLNGIEGTTLRLLFSKSSALLVGFSQSGEIRQWTLKDWAQDEDVPRTVYAHPQDGVTRIAQSADAMLLAHVSNHGGLVLSDFRGKAPAHYRLLQQVGLGTSLRFIGGSKYLAFGDLGGALRIWDASRPGDSGKPIAEYNLGGRLEDAVFSRSGGYVALVGGRNPATLRVLRMTSGNPPRFEPICEKQNLVDQVIPGFNGSSFLAVFRYGDNIILGSIEPADRDCRVHEVDNAPEGYFSVGAISLLHSIFAYAKRGANGPVLVLRRLDAQSGTASIELQELSGLEVQLTAIAFSPDASWLSAGDSRGNLFLWHRGSDGQYVQTIKATAHQSSSSGMNSDVYQIVFDPDGKWMASTSFLRRNMLLWDLTQMPPSFARVAPFDSNVGPVLASPGNKLILGRTQGAVEIWPVGVAALITRACKITSVRLTGEEWKSRVGTLPAKPPCASSSNPFASGRLAD